MGSPCKRGVEVMLDVFCRELSTLIHIPYKTQEQTRLGQSGGKQSPVNIGQPNYKQEIASRKHCVSMSQIRHCPIKGNTEISNNVSLTTAGAEARTGHALRRDQRMFLSAISYTRDIGAKE